MSDRRTLAFSSLNEIMPEVDRLLLGHRTVGNWSLGQVCNHLSTGMILSVDGFPGSAPWIIRRTVGPIVGRRIFRSDRLPKALKLPKEFEPRAELDARAEAEALRAAIQCVRDHAGPFADHPFLGTLTRDEWQRFHAIHSAHHLAYVLPEA